jgi:N-acetylmuramoyl-L-alanine amidase
LCRGIIIRREVPPHRVLAHSDVAPSRKQDPGEKFPWRSLADSGVGLWIEPAPIVKGEMLRPGATGDQVRDLQAALARFGYSIEADGRYDVPTREVVTAFQRHYRPERVDGIADPSTLKTLQALLAALPASKPPVAAAS